MDEEYKVIYWINPSLRDEAKKVSLPSSNFKDDKSWIKAPWRVYLKNIKRIYKEGSKVFIQLGNGEELEILNSSLEQTKNFFKPKKSIEERVGMLEKRFDAFLKVNRPRGQ